MPFTLKNESKRSFQFGKIKDWKSFKPNEVAIFNDETGVDLLKHKGVIDVNNVTIAFDQTKVQDFSSAEEKSEKISDKKLAEALKAGKK